MFKVGPFALLLQLLLVGCGTSTDAESPATSRTTTQSTQPTQALAPPPSEPPPTVQLDLLKQKNRNPGVRIINSGDAPTQILSSLRITPAEMGATVHEIELRIGNRRGQLISDETSHDCLTLVPGAELILPAGSRGVDSIECTEPCPDEPRQYRFIAQSCLRTQEVHSELWSHLGP